jgi:uncharacterized protein YbjT (DUF2867 family)
LEKIKNSTVLKTALIIGSTGLVGSHLLQLLLDSESYDNVISFERRDTGKTHAKLTQHIIDFDKPESYQNLVVGDDFFCTIGTTIKNAGSKEAFRKVDYQYPKEFASVALQNGVKQFLLLSSLDANENSGNFYLKTKGEIQLFLKKSAFKSVSILQPSLLLGDRHEFRFAEKVGGILMSAFSFLFFGKFKKYRPIQASAVAKALYATAKKGESGFHIYKSDALQKLADNF